MRVALPLTVFFICAAFAVSTFAQRLTYVSDLISTSAPGTDATHTIQFTTTQAVPASGHILITFQSGAFTIPAAFDYTDVDFAVGSGGSYTDRALAATADATHDGVTVTTGTNGVINIELNSSAGLSIGDEVQIRLGTNATFGSAGVENINNPSGITSYRIEIETRNSSNTIIDNSTAMIAVVEPVGLSATQIVYAPQRSNGLPSGLVAANNQIIELSLQTDVLANCRYSTTPGVLYDSMTNGFNPSSGTTHYVNTNPYVNNTSYIYYVRCKSTNGGAKNTDDYEITFSLKPTPSSNTSIESEGFITTGETGDLGRGGSGDYPYGSSVLFLSSVTFSGYTVPNGTVTILKDGTKVETVQAGGTGVFQKTVSGLERGAYGFQLYVQDSAGRTSSLYGATLSIAQGTDNIVSNIVIPPTVQISSDSIGAGDPLLVSGRAIPNAKIELTIVGQTGSANLADVKTFFATSSADGAWNIDLDTSRYAKGTYAAAARAIKSDSIKSSISKILILAVGTNTSGNINRSDINRDGKVNLIDFSILLSFWNSANPDADINEDGNVNLGDFSIMLFNWTG